MNGKTKCKILKNIRRQIAEANDIDFFTSECKYRGSCLGTCPKCEAEVLYLCEQLEARKQMGKAVALTGLSVGLLASSMVISSCSGRNEIKNDSSPIGIERTVLHDKAKPDSFVKESKDSVVETEEAEKVLNSMKVTELLIAGNPSPVIKGVFDLNIEDGPKYPGGDEVLYKYVTDELQKIDFENHVDFSIEAWLVIGADGRVKSIHKRDYGCSSNYWDKVDSILMHLSMFKPGEYNGEAVDSWYWAYGSWKASVNDNIEIKDTIENISVDTLKKEDKIQ